MLTVDIDVDPGGEQLLDVLPALGVAGAGDVGVGEFVHERHLRAPGEDRVHVHLGEDACPGTPVPCARICSRPCSITSVRGRSWCSTKADDAVGAPLDPAVRLGEHRVRLADARRRAEVDPELAASHVAAASHASKR